MMFEDSVFVEKIKTVDRIYVYLYGFSGRY